MYFNVAANTPAMGGAYLPYHYWIYARSPGRKTGDPTSESASRFDFSSDLVPKPGKDTQTIDKIITDGYFAVPPSQPETSILSDKKHVFSLGLADTILQIRRRYEIYERNLKEIAESQCAAMNTFFDLESLIGPVAAASREAHRLNKSLQDLYGEERLERVKLWEDVSRLRQALPEAAQAYLSARRKVALLGDLQGDGP